MQRAMACPECGHNEFTVNAVRYVEAHIVADNAGEIEQVDSRSDHTEWDENSPCRCRKCNHHGTAKIFFTFVTLADRGVPSDSRTAQALLSELKESQRALAITPEEGMQLLGANDMMLEYVPGLEHPWRVRYHHAPAAARDAPNRYTLHAHGSTWEAALTAALGVTVIAWQPPSQPVTA